MAAMRHALKNVRTPLSYHDDLLLRIIRGKADAHKLAGHFEDGIRDLERILVLIRGKKRKDHVLEAETLMHISNFCYDGLSDYKRARESANLAMKKIDPRNEPELYARGLVALGTIARCQDDYRRAFVCYKKTLDIYTRLDDRRGLIDAYNCMGSVSWSTGRLDDALAYYRKDLAVARELRDRSAVAAALGNLGIVSWQKGDFRCAMEYYKKNMKICRQIGFRKGLAIGCGNIGIVYRHMGKHDKALGYFKQQLSINESVGHQMGIAIAYSNISSIFYAKKEYDAALSYMKKYLALSESMKYKRGIGIASSNIGGIYFMQKKFRAALSYFAKYLSISEKTGYKRGIGVGGMYTGKAYRILGDFKNASKHLLRSNKVLRALGDKVSLSECYTELSRLQTAEGRYRQALSLARKAIALAMVSGSKEKEVIAREALELAQKQQKGPR